MMVTFRRRRDGTIDQKSILPEVRDRMATTEHRFSRLNPQRGQVPGETTTLLCWRCNNRLGAEEHRQTPREILYAKGDGRPVTPERAAEILRTKGHKIAPRHRAVLERIAAELVPVAVPA